MKKIWISKQFLEQEYLQNRKSTIVIANELGLCSNTVRRRLRDFGISRRTISESRIGMQLSEKHKQNIKKGMFGITRSKNARKNYSRSKLGKLNPQ